MSVFPYCWLVPNSSVQPSPLYCNSLLLYSELMTMYQSKVEESSLSLQKLQVAEGQLRYLDNCIHVHKKEMDIMHQVSRRGEVSARQGLARSSTVSCMLLEAT